MGTPNVNGNLFVKAEAYAKTLEGYKEGVTKVLLGNNTIEIDFDGDKKIDMSVDSSVLASDTFKPQNTNLVNLLFKLKNLEDDKSVAKDETAKAAIDKQILAANDEIKKLGSTPEQLQKAEREVELRNCLEIKMVYKSLLDAAEKKNDSAEIARCKRELARAQFKINQLQASDNEVKAINDEIYGPGDLPEAKEDKKDKEEQPLTLEQRAQDMKGKDFKVTNSQNPNGSIDGTIEDIKYDENGDPTSISIKSKKSQNVFTYEYDEKTKRFVNTKEPNKYYELTEDLQFVRDNKLGKPARAANEHGEAVVTGALDKERLAAAKKLGVGYTGAGNLYKKTDDKGSTVYYEWNDKDKKFVENKNIVQVTPPVKRGTNYIVLTKTREGFNEDYYSLDGKLQQRVMKDANRNHLGRIEYNEDSTASKVYNKEGKLVKESVKGADGKYQEKVVKSNCPSDEELEAQDKKLIGMLSNGAYALIEDSSFWLFNTPEKTYFNSEGKPISADAYKQMGKKYADVLNTEKAKRAKAQQEVAKQEKADINFCRNTKTTYIKLNNGAYKVYTGGKFSYYGADGNHISKAEFLKMEAQYGRA